MVRSPIAFPPTTRRHRQTMVNGKEVRQHATREEPMKVLTPAEVESYRYNGFLFPVPALSDAERLRCLEGLQRYEQWLGKPVPKADLKWRTQPHALLPWYADLVRHPRILDAIEDLIGPDILVWTGTFFIKEP